MIQQTASMESLHHVGKFNILPTYHEIVISIRQNKIEYMNDLLSQLSSPNSHNYQEWLTYDHINNLIDCKPSHDVVVSWLKENNIKVNWSSNQYTYIKAETHATHWESVLQMDINLNERNKHLKSSYSYTDYTLPAHLLPHISHIFYTTDIHANITKFAKYRNTPISLPEDTNNTNSPKNNSSFISHFLPILTYPTKPVDVVTIPHLNEYYQVMSNYGDSSFTQTVFETNDEYYSSNDLTKFQVKYKLPIQSIHNIGGHDTAQCGVNGYSCSEGNLDVQYIQGMSQNVNTIYWYFDNIANPFVTWITYVSHQSDPAAVHSISWGSDEVNVPSSVKDQFNIEALKLSLMGVTILVSSGDDGVSNVGCQCSADSGSTVSGWPYGSTWSGTGYFPNFPATSPYVTAVGATMGTKHVTPEIGEGERACQSNLGGVITSGGGFSTYYPRPSYQDTAINSYFTSLGSNMPSSGYNPQGRGYPDISLLGVEYSVMMNGNIQFAYGTSASTPTFAAMISLINSIRLRNNMTTVGFINPTLYDSTHKAYFTDITSGRNHYCSYENNDINNAPSCASGFYATAGWDPVTGLGSVTFPNLALIFNVTAPYTRKSSRSSLNPILYILANIQLFGLSTVVTYVILVSLFVLCMASIVLTCMIIRVHYLRRKLRKVRPMGSARMIVPHEELTHDGFQPFAPTLTTVHTNLPLSPRQQALSSTHSDRSHSPPRQLRVQSCQQDNIRIQPSPNRITLISPRSSSEPSAPHSTVLVHITNISPISPTSIPLSAHNISQSSDMARITTNTITSISATSISATNKPPESTIKRLFGSIGFTTSSLARVHPSAPSP